MSARTTIPFAPLPGHSRKSLNRAGEVLRSYFETDGEKVTNEVLQAYVAMTQFRETFQAPLNKTVNGLRSMVCTECPELKAPGAPLPVVQRLKRREQILNKLCRLPGTALANMGDIGGCRAILPTHDDVDAVVKRIRKNWTVHGVIRDTRAVAAASGYRAVHVIVIRDGRRIEIQLRVQREHEWAVTVERTGSRLGIPLKEGEGPADLKKYFYLASEGMYLDSVGVDPGPAFKVAFQEARESARRYFTR